jgi:hypothetical protein
MFGSIDKTTAAGNHRRANGIFIGTESKNIPALPRRHHVAMRYVYPQRSIAKKAKAEIHFRFQSVMKSVGIVVNLAAFTSPCPWFVAALRGACHPTKSARRCRNAIREQDFLLPK